MSKLDRFLEVPRRMDRWLKKVVGRENDLLYHFLRLLLIAVVFALVVGVVVEVVSVVFRAISIVISEVISARYYLLAVAIVAGIAALIVYFRRMRAKRQQKVESLGESAGAMVPQKLSQAKSQSRRPTTTQA